MKKSQSIQILSFTSIIVMIIVIIVVLPNELVPQDNCDPSIETCYKNPVLDLGNEQIGDPAVVYYNSTYYMVGTAPGHYSAGQIRMWSSSNLMNWTDEGVIYQASLNQGDWNTYMFWAAEICIYEKEESVDFYLSYSASPDTLLQNHRIGIAHSKNITGPYTDLLQNPLFDLGVETIDQHIFIEEDTPYMLYTNHHGVDSTYLVELNKEMNSTMGEHQLLFSRRSNEDICEAPWMYRKNGYYYILYSANSGNTVDYKIGYYRAESLLGPYVWKGYILAKTNYVYGPGHCSVVESPSGDNEYIVYQTKKNSEVNWERYIALDLLELEENGDLVCRGPTQTYQPIPI